MLPPLSPPSQRVGTQNRGHDLRDVPNVPSLSTATATASVMQSQTGPTAPINPHKIDELTIDPDRVLSTNHGDGDYSSSDYEDINRMRSAYWMEQLYSEEIDEAK